AHTPIQLQMLNNAAAQMQAATAGLQLPVSNTGNFSVFSGFIEALGNVASLGQDIPLFAQAFAFSGASIGAVLSESEHKASGQPGGSVAKPKTPETPHKVSRPKVIFQSSGGGSRGERKAALSVQSKPKTQERGASNL